MATLKKLINPNVFAGAANSWDSTPTAYDSPNPAPDDAFAPPTNARSGISLSPAFNPNTSGQPDVVRDIYQPQLRDIGQKLSEAYNPPQLGVGGTLRHVVGSLFARRNPQLGAIVSGDYGRLQNINALTKQYGLTEDAINQERAANTAALQNANIASEIGARADLAKYHEGILNTKREPPAKTPEEQAYQDLIDKGTDPLAALQKVKAIIQKDTKPSEEDKALSDYLQAHNLPDSPANRDKARSVLKTRDRKATDPEIQDINKQLKQAQLQKALEPSNDEQRRADLARNMNVNLDQLDEILSRRPDLFGPVAGRMTQVANFVGTKDPDKARLKAIREYLGMASVGAHAMRNAQHVGTAADAVMNGFLNSPKATKAAIDEAKKSTATFLADEKRRGNKALLDGQSAAPTDPNDPGGLFSKP